MLPWPDAHDRERGSLVHLLDALEPGQLWVADRGFRTRASLRAFAARGAYLLVRGALGLRGRARGVRRAGAVASRRRGGAPGVRRQVATARVPAAGTVDDEKDRV